jgi:hypothetical protein
MFTQRTVFRRGSHFPATFTRCEHVSDTCKVGRFAIIHRR